MVYYVCPFVPFERGNNVFPWLDLVIILCFIPEVKAHLGPFKIDCSNQHIRLFQPKPVLKKLALQIYVGLRDLAETSVHNSPYIVTIIYVLATRREVKWIVPLTNVFRVR